MAKKKDAASNGLATVTGDAFDFEAAKAKSVLASSRMIEMIDQSERQSIGAWYYTTAWPDERMKNWHFIRCGMRGRDSSLALAGKLKGFGYVEAPRGVMCVGFESDGDNMLVMCAPPETRANMRHFKNIEKMRIGANLKDSFGDVQAAVGRHGDVKVAGSSGRGSEGDLREAMRGASSIL